MPAPSTARLIVSLVIKRGNKVLVLHEPDDKGAVRFNLPGGHVLPKESLLDAAKREAYEETGYRISVGRTISVITSTWQDGTHSVRQSFVGRILRGALKTEQGTEARWMTREQIAAVPERAFVFGVKQVLQRVFDKRFIDPDGIDIRKFGRRLTSSTRT